MSTKNDPPRKTADEVLAELTDAAYRVALRHGLKGSFLEAELELWWELGHILRQRGWGEVQAGRGAASTTMPAW